MLAGGYAEGVAGEGDGGWAAAGGLLLEGLEVRGDVLGGVEFEGARGEGEMGWRLHYHDHEGWRVGSLQEGGDYVAILQVEGGAIVENLFTRI